MPDLLERRHRFTRVIASILIERVLKAGAWLAHRLLWQVFFPECFLKFLKWAIMPPMGFCCY